MMRRSQVYREYVTSAFVAKNGTIGNIIDDWTTMSQSELCEYVLVLLSVTRKVEVSVLSSSSSSSSASSFHITLISSLLQTSFLACCTGVIIYCASMATVCYRTICPLSSSIKALAFCHKDWLYE
jgi:hypothetical protein